MGQDAPMRIWVVGQYGCLASWIGHALGSSRNSRFIDGEETMADLSGRSMADLARTDKDERHDWASCYVRYVTSEPGTIVASVPACVADDHDDTQLLVHSGTLVYLRLSRDTLVTYATSDPRQHRSATQVQGWLDRVFDGRDQALSRAAHHVVDVVSGSGTDARAATTAVNLRLRPVTVIGQREASRAVSTVPATVSAGVAAGLLLRITSACSNTASPSTR